MYGETSMSETLIAAAEEVKRKIQDLAQQILQDERMAELKKLLTGLNTLEDLCSQPQSQMGSFFDFGQPDAGSSNIRPDEFYGLEPIQAAKRYLRKIGKSASIRDIVAALKSGGCDPGNDKAFALSLARSTMEIAKIGDDLFGLVEFYPHLKRERGPRKKKGNGGAESPTATAGDSASPQGSNDEGDEDTEEEKSVSAEAKTTAPHD
jgi:hypothetical protein